MTYRYAGTLDHLRRDFAELVSPQFRPSDEAIQAIWSKWSNTPLTKAEYIEAVRAERERFLK